MLGKGFYLKRLKTAQCLYVPCFELESLTRSHWLCPFYIGPSQVKHAIHTGRDGQTLIAEKRYEYDLAGRLVRTLVDDEVMAAGRREVVWQGRDRFGRRVASGTYFYRLEAGEYSETMRMALIQ